jgi:hypothetical protein
LSFSLSSSPVGWGLLGTVDALVLTSASLAGVLEESAARNSSRTPQPEPGLVAEELSVRELVAVDLKSVVSAVVVLLVVSRIIDGFDRLTFPAG